MTQRYYTGSKLKTLLSGDKVLGRNLIKKARAYTGYLFDQLTENQKYRTQRWNNPDGSKIQVFVWRDVLGERALARILVAKTALVGADTVAILLFENGMLKLAPFMTEDYSSTPELDPLPLSVEIGASLSAYFAGVGTQSATLNSFFHLQGRVNVDSDFLADAQDNPMPGGLYESAIYTRDLFLSSSRISKLIFQLATEQATALVSQTPAVTLASNYTGLMRLAVQAWLARGRSPGPATYLSISSEVYFCDAEDYPCPFSSPAPYTDGLIYDDNYNFWWARISGSEIVFRKLKTSAPLSFTQNILQNWTGTEADKQTYLVALISSLSPDEEQEEVSVALPSLADVTGGGRSPLAYGWHFNRKPAWQAAIVTIREGAGSTTSAFYWEATRAHIDISFVSGIPTAALTIDVPDLEVSNVTKYSVHYYSGSLFTHLYASHENVTPAPEKSGEMPLYCYYTQDNNLDILTVSSAYYSGSIAAGTAQTPCGANTVTYELGSGSYQNAGGFKTGSVTAETGFAISMSHNQYIDQQYAIGSLTAADITTALPGCTWSASDHYKTVCNGNIPAAYYFEVDKQRGLRRQEQRVWDQSTYSMDRYAAIPGGDAECVYMIGVEHDYKGSVQVNIKEHDPATNTGQDILIFYKYMWYRCYRWEPYTKVSFVGTVDQPIGWAGDIKLSSSAEGGYDVWRTKVVISSSVGVFTEENEASFAGSFPGCRASFSFDGGGRYSDTFSSGYKYVGGYSGDTGEIRWIGQA